MPRSGRAPADCTRTKAGWPAAPAPSLRVDPSEHFLGLRLNFYVASALALSGLGWFLRTQRKAKLMTGATVTLVAAVALGSLACCAQTKNPAAAGPAHPRSRRHRVTWPAQGPRLGRRPARSLGLGPPSGKREEQLLQLLLAHRRVPAVGQALPHAACDDLEAGPVQCL